MILKQILDIEKTLGRRLPIDMRSNMEYYNHSKKEWIDVLKLDTVQAIRILRKHIREESNE
jgi:hypothetical protein